MHSKLSRVSWLSAVGLTALVAACSENNGVAPRASLAQPQLPSVNFSQSGTPVGQEWIIQSKTFGSTASIEQAVTSMGGTVSRSWPQIGVVIANGLTGLQAVSLGAQNTNIAAVNGDKTLQWVPSAQDLAVGLAGDADPSLGASGTNQSTAAFFNSFQWGMKVTHANAAWTASPGGAGRMVCVLDTGVDPGHLDLNGKVNTGVSASFSSDASFAGNATIFDYHFHGTFVSSIISSNGIGVASVAPDANLCAVKVLNQVGSGSFSDVMAGIMYAASIHASVINMSLGAYFDLRGGGSSLVQALQKAVDFANAQGTVVVAASGNNGVNLDADPGDVLSIPAQLKGVISVGATGPIRQANFDGLASYSNYGGVTGIALVAPGGSGAPVFQQDLIIGACSRFALTFNCVNGNNYLIGSGTSFASPHVAGAAAEILSQYGNLHTSTVRKCLTTTADNVGSSAIFGAGRLNVFRAVTQCVI